MDLLQKNNNMPDWQIRQARQTVQVYLVNFKGKTESEALSLSAASVAKSSDVSGIIEEMKRSIRLKHFSLTRKVHFDERTAGTYASKPLERRMCVCRASKRRG
jgi:hypothetical protein